MDNRKKLLTEIMEADAKDGLYEEQTTTVQEVGHSVQVDVIDLIQFLSMNKEFNGYGSVSKETANYFLEQFKKQ